MENPGHASKEDPSDVTIGLVLAIIICTAIFTGIQSYSFNNRIVLSAIIALIVVLQGLFTWWFSGRSK